MSINPIGPINEVMVVITNIIRRSEIGCKHFDYTEAGEKAFYEWQTAIMDTAIKIYAHWNEENLIVEHLITKLEKTLEEVLPRTPYIKE